LLLPFWPWASSRNAVGRRRGKGPFLLAELFRYAGKGGEEKRRARASCLSTLLFSERRGGKKGRIRAQASSNLSIENLPLKRVTSAYTSLAGDRRSKKNTLNPPIFRGGSLLLSYSRRGVKKKKNREVLR